MGLAALRPTHRCLSNSGDHDDTIFISGRLRMVHRAFYLTIHCGVLPRPQTDRQNTDIQTENCAWEKVNTNWRPNRRITLSRTYNPSLSMNNADPQCGMLLRCCSFELKPKKDRKLFIKNHLCLHFSHEKKKQIHLFFVRILPTFCVFDRAENVAPK